MLSIAPPASPAKPPFSASHYGAAFCEDTIVLMMMLGDINSPYARRTVGCIRKWVKWLHSKWTVKLLNKWKTKLHKPLGIKDKTEWIAKLLRLKIGDKKQALIPGSFRIWPRYWVDIKPYIVSANCCMAKWHDISFIAPETGLQPRSSVGRWVWEYFVDNYLCYDRAIYCYSE